MKWVVTEKGPNEESPLFSQSSGRERIEGFAGVARLRLGRPLWLFNEMRAGARPRPVQSLNKGSMTS